MSENDDRESLRMEPRRPQVGDAIAVRVTKHGSWSVDVVAKTDGIAIRVAQEPGWFFPEEAEAFRTWRWPATQGAAVAGPARELCGCGHAKEQHFGPDFLPCHAVTEWLDNGGANNCRCFAFVAAQPPPPASEPPTAPEEAAFLRGASLSVTKMAEQVRLLRVDLDAAVAGKAALEVRLAEALVLVAPFGGGDLRTGLRHLQRSLEREIAEHQRHHEVEDALCAEIASERAAHEATWASLDRRAKERDALAERLNTARGLLAEVIEGVDAGRISITVGQENRIRAALAASGPAKEGAK